jgi:hypothetical protein
LALASAFACSSTTSGTTKLEGTGGGAGSTGLGGDTSSTGGTSSGGTGATGGTVSEGGAAGSGTGGGAPLVGCAGIERPAGVLEADFTCVDFEDGLPTDGWAQKVSGSGTVGVTTDVAESAPQSFQAFVADVDTVQSAGIEWSVVGADPVKVAGVRASINPKGWLSLGPKWGNGISLLCVSFGSGQACLSHTRGGAIDGAEYTGYYIYYEYSGGPAYAGTCPISGELDVNLWNDVTLEFDDSADIAVTINGEEQEPCSGGNLASTTATVLVGVDNVSGQDENATIRYDNVSAWVQR